MKAKKIQEMIRTKKPWNVTAKRFVCFFDIMGFKDMVMRDSHINIYNMLDEFSKARKSLESPNIPDTYGNDSLKTVSFSDTIVVFTKDDSKECLELLTFAASWLFGKAIQTGIPMKGAISHGDMSVNIAGQIFFGQPLIDAYLLEEELAFYGIVIHNSAEEILNQNIEELVGKEKYIDCLVPFKTGKINHYILDWISTIGDNNRANQKKDALELMKKQREHTSGSPRRYIDNTIDVINQIFKE